MSSVPDEDDAFFSKSRFLPNFDSMFMFHLVVVLFHSWEYYAKDEITNVAST